MKKIINCLVLAAILTAASLPAAGVPRLLSYHGVIGNIAQATFPDGNLPVRFALYGAAAGSEPLWQEDFEVAMQKGVFHVRLGEIQPFPAGLFQLDQLYLGIKIGDDAEARPRQRLVASAFALSAKTCDNALLLDGLEADDFARANHRHEEYALASHAHDGHYQPAGSYAPADHAHDGRYQPAGSYAPAEHAHDGRYQPAGSYAPASHVHDGRYQPRGEYASASHGHDGRYQPRGEYAAAAHSHDSRYFTRTVADGRYCLRTQVEQLVQKWAVETYSVSLRPECDGVEVDVDLDRLLQNSSYSPECLKVYRPAGKPRYASGLEVPYFNDNRSRLRQTVRYMVSVSSLGDYRTDWSGEKHLWTHLYVNNDEQSARLNILMKKINALGYVIKVTAFLREEPWKNPQASYHPLY